MNSDLQSQHGDADWHDDLFLFLRTNWDSLNIFFSSKKSPQLFIYSKKCLFIDGACCKTSRARGLCRWRCTMLPMRSRDLISCWGCVRHMRSRDLISWLVCQRQRAAWWSELLPGQPAGTVCVCEMKKQKHTTTLKLLNKNKCK